MKLLVKYFYTQKVKNKLKEKILKKLKEIFKPLVFKDNLILIKLINCKLILLFTITLEIIFLK